MLKSALLIFLSFSSILGFGLSSHAYIVATPPWQTAPLDYSKPTRIVLAGRGSSLDPKDHGGLGIQPQESGRTAMMLYHRNFPNDQLVLISVIEANPTEKALIEAKKPLPAVLENEKDLTEWGWKFVTKNNLHLETQVATTEMLKFAKIQSLEIFGHNSAILGTQTDGSGFRFDTYQPIVSRLTSHFMPGAYAWIHGCNSGWLMAQDLSRKWGILVGGAFTETRFEHLHSDGHFYVYDNNYSPSNSWARSNPEFPGTTCTQGGCIRMHPAFSHYIGEWGDFSGPLLSHYHFFCQLEMQDCEKRMASALYGYISEHSLTPSSTIEQFKAVAKDFLCPVYKDRVITDACNADLDAIANNGGDIHTFFNYVNKKTGVMERQLSCTIRSCSGKMTCEGHTCSIAGRESKGSSTLAQDYMHFIRGYQALHPEAK